MGRFTLKTRAATWAMIPRRKKMVAKVWMRVTAVMNEGEKYTAG
jgi:hypothetical protein